MKILFITRKYPPSIGGMQKVNYQLYSHLSKISDTKILYWNKSQKWLPVIYPYLLFLGIVKTKTYKPQVVHLGDALMSPMGVIIKKISKVKVSCIIHGLDITFQFPGYQKIIPYFLKRIDKLICVSSATEKECLKRGIPKIKIEVIPNGINPNEYLVNKPKQILRNNLKKSIDLDLNKKKVILTIGRLVKRKGHVWFINNVMPYLPKKTLYLIVGEGPEESRIRKTITKRKLKKQVFLLGKVNEETKKLLFNCADLLVMPNIRVKGDMEGFGIVALEASSCSLPVVASEIEGIKDAIKKGKNGILIKEKDQKGFIKAIELILNNEKRRKLLGKKAKEYAFKNYAWDKIAKKYLKTFSLITNK